METLNPNETILIQALTTLVAPQFSDLTHTISALFHRHRHRLLSLLSSPTLFSLTIHHLHSLSLHHKSLLIARYLLSNLTILTHFMQTNSTPPPYPATSMKLRDLDSVLLLLLLCELRQHDDTALLHASPPLWRGILSNFVSNSMLKISGLGASSSEILIKYITEVVRCKNFVNTMCCEGRGRGKEGKEVAASVAVVVALPSIEVRESGKECVICKEEMVIGRDVCKLPCDHMFHWICVLPWLKKRNTCPCCRFQLPTDDVFGEIERLWAVLVKIGGSC